MDVANLPSPDPLRPVDWRFQAAFHHVERGLQLSRHDLDDATFRLVQYLRRRRNCRAPTSIERLVQQFPDLHVAVELFESARGTRFLLEARILTGSPIGAIAQQTRITQGAVRWYASLFFDVWSRLDCADFILDCVIGLPQSAAYEWRDVGWKLIGYFGGADALSEMLCLERKNGLDGFLHGLQLETRVALTYKMLAAAQSVRLSDNKTRFDLIKLNVADRGKRVQEEGSSNSIEANLKAMLESLPFRSLSIGDPVSEYDKWAAELTTAELCSVAAGEELPNAEEIKNLRFPSN